MILYFFSNNNKFIYRRYFKIFLKSFFLIFGLSSIIGNLLVLYSDYKWSNFYENDEKVQLNAVIESDLIEKNYYYECKIKISEGKYKNRKLILKVKKNKDISINYGQKIYLTGKYREPEIQRNDNGFNYKLYLKSQKVYGSIVCNSYSIKVIKERDVNFLSFNIHNFKKGLIEKSKKWLPDESGNLLFGLILGEKNGLTEEVEENFRNSSLAHLLVVSGAHVSYLVLGITILLNILNVPKKLTYIISCMCLIVFYIMVRLQSINYESNNNGNISFDVKINI